MNHHFRNRTFFPFLLLALLLLPALSAQGEGIAPVDGFPMPSVSVCTFGSECPADIRRLLEERGHRQTAVICGAAMLDDAEEKEASQRWNAAVLLAEAENSRFLMALQWLADGSAVQLDEYAMQGIDLWAVTDVQPVVEGLELYRRRFALRFADGSAYELFSGFGSFWRVYGYQSPEGEHITLLGGELCLNGEYHPVPYEAWLGDPMAAAGFPRSEEEARLLLEQRWQAVLTDGRAMINGANLREKPTASSRSLGKYINALGEVLEQRPGKHQPWYRVRIGGTEGWVSGPYVTYPEDRQRYAGRYGSEYAVAVREAALLRLPQGGETVMQLAPGTAMQVLADTGEGWLHVLVTEGGLTLRPEAKGVYGYIPAEAVRWMKKVPQAPGE